MILLLLLVLSSLFFNLKHWTYWFPMFLHALFLHLLYQFFLKILMVTLSPIFSIWLGELSTGFVHGINDTMRIVYGDKSSIKIILQFKIDNYYFALILNNLLRESFVNIQRFSQIHKKYLIHSFTNNRFYMLFYYIFYFFLRTNTNLENPPLFLLLPKVDLQNRFKSLMNFH